MWKAMYRPLGWLSHAPCRQGGCPDAADGSLLNGMKANISEADVSLNAVHVAEGSAAGRPAPAQPVAAVTKTDGIPCSGRDKPNGKQ